jgi:hypothetical protein
MAAACLATALAGCASAPESKSLAKMALPSSNAYVAQRVPTLNDKYSVTDLEGTYFGSGGSTGGIWVGVWFGPLGVMGSMLLQQAQNRDLARPMQALTQLDLADVLVAQLPEQARSGIGYELVPSATYAFRDRKTYRLSCTLAVRDTTTTWKARYTVTLPGLRTVGDEDTARAKEELGPCLKRAHDLFVVHVDHTLPFEPGTLTVRDADDDTVETPVLYVRTLWPQRAVMQDEMGVVDVPREDVVSLQ